MLPCRFPMGLIHLSWKGLLDLPNEWWTQVQKVLFETFPEATCQSDKVILHGCKCVDRFYSGIHTNCWSMLFFAALCLRPLSPKLECKLSCTTTVCLALPTTWLWWRRSTSKKVPEPDIVKKFLNQVLSFEWYLMKDHSSEVCNGVSSSQSLTEGPWSGQVYRPERWNQTAELGKTSSCCFEIVCSANILKSIQWVPATHKMYSKN